MEATVRFKDGEWHDLKDNSDSNMEKGLEQNGITSKGIQLEANLVTQGEKKVKIASTITVWAVILF